MCSISFRDFESYLRIVVGLDEDDIQLILKQYVSIFVTYELSPGINWNKDISEAVYTRSDHNRTLQNEYDGVSMKTKPILTQFGSTFGTFRLDEKSFLGLCWDLLRFGIISQLMPFTLIAQAFTIVINFCI